jgi:hypothetical protein
MHAAADICRTDKIEQLAIVPATFSKISIQVDAMHGSHPFGRNAFTTISFVVR